MNAMHEKKLAALPEVRINKDLCYFEVNGKKLNPENFPTLKGAKIDLFIGDKSEIPKAMKLRTVLEIKSTNSNWGSFLSDI